MKKNILFSLFLSLVLFSCKQNTEPVATIDLTQYESFGEEFPIDGLLSSQNMREVYDSLKIGDTLEVRFITKVNTICQKKGCWMRLDLGEDNLESFVRFKNYAFFVPKDMETAEAIVKGVAFKAETSVEALKHYAEDAGKSEEEIAAITQAKVEYSFIADGVLLKKQL